MGMYTELYLNFELKQSTPTKIIESLKLMTSSQGWTDDSIKNYPLLTTSRWPLMLQSWSFSFTPHNTMQLKFEDITKCWSLTGVCSFKNYDNEINLFLDWIAPYIDGEPGSHIGHYRYEEDTLPTILFLPQDKKSWNMEIPHQIVQRER